MGNFPALSLFGRAELGKRKREMRRGGRMGDDKIQSVGGVRKKGKNVRACGSEVRGLHLTNSANPLDQGGKEPDQAIVTDTTQVLKFRTGEEVQRISGKTGGGRARARAR